MKENTNNISEKLFENVVTLLKERNVILSDNELVVVRRFIYNLDNVHIFDKEEIEKLKAIMTDYEDNSDFRILISFLIDVFQNEEDRKFLRILIYIPKVLKFIWKLIIWIRNFAIVVIPTYLLGSSMSGGLDKLIEVFLKL